MSESSREPLRSPHRSLLSLGLGLLLVIGLGGVGCKKRDVGIEPALPPDAEVAEPIDTNADRDTRPTRPPATEVDPGFDPDRFDTEEIDQGQLSADDIANMVQEQLRTVFFGYDQSELSETTRRVLETNAKILSLNPGVSVVVEGHCDERGTIEYNLALGQRRAESVRQYLINLGVEGRRLRTVSYGEERPVDTGGTESAWSRNRRAAFVVE